MIWNTYYLLVTFTAIVISPLVDCQDVNESQYHEQSDTDSIRHNMIGNQD